MSLLLATLLVIFTIQSSNAQPPADKYYYDQGGYKNECPIRECSVPAQACAIGYYLSGCGGSVWPQTASAGNCLATCTNFKPAVGGIYTTNGGILATGCGVGCDPLYQLSGSGATATCTLRTCTNLITNSELVLGYKVDGTGCTFRCSAGYKPSGVSADGKGPAQCIACLKGQYSNAGDATCSNCIAGYISAVEGTATCTRCDESKGQYQVGTGRTICDGCIANCDVGKWKSGCGFDSAGTCTACSNTNYYNLNGGSGGATS